MILVQNNSGHIHQANDDFNKNVALLIEIDSKAMQTFAKIVTQVDAFSSYYIFTLNFYNLINDRSILNSYFHEIDEHESVIIKNVNILLGWIIEFLVIG